MKKGHKKNDEDDLLPEYDLSKLRVVKMGPGRLKKGRKKVNVTRVTLDPKVASIFKNEASVNRALHFLIKLAKKEARVSR